MQRKHLYFLLSIFLLIGVLVGCGTSTDNEIQTNSQEVNINEQTDFTEISEQPEKSEDETIQESTTSKEELTTQKAPATDETVNKQSIQGAMIVYFIDVGQADATLFMGPDFTVLVDAGRHDRSDIVPYLQYVGVKHIDLLVGTHPHADHIGQFDKIINSFTISEVWMDGNAHTTRTFERAIDSILSSGADYNEPRAGEQYQIGSLLIDVLNPTHLTGDFHDDGIAVRIKYGDIAILLTGDIEKDGELKMIKDKRPIESQIFHLGHHGSRTSNTQDFLDVVKPEVAIYSAGLNNSYGHPHLEVVDRINKMGINLYGTDIHGTITITTDGKTYDIFTSKTNNFQPITDMPVEIPTQVEPTKPVENNTKGTININFATKDELMQIVHIGEERAEQLITLRPFSSLDQLTKINGIAAGRLKNIKEEGKAYVD